MIRNKRVGYAIALLIGLAWTGLTFPAWMLLGQLPTESVTNTDLIQHVMGQRYFWHEPWHIHRLLFTRNLDVPYGVMIGLTDSLPLIALLLKPFIGWFPPFFQAVTPWLAICWILQPVSAVFALRSAGESRILPAAVVAACASTMPTFLLRLSHAALSSHFLILLAVGISLRLSASRARPPADAGHRFAGSWLLAGGMLIPTLLLIHPYLMMMAVIVLFAAPITLMIRRDRRWISTVAGLSVASLCTGFLAKMLGYLGAEGSEGFGLYSMNLLSPIWPETSWLLGHKASSPLDATGGQYEGFQYLGPGLLLGSMALFFFNRSRNVLWASVRHHPGLLLSCLTLTLIALSNQIYLGHVLLVSFPQPPGTGVFRAGGRFFWPVAYVVLVGTIAGLAKVSWRPMPALLVSIALLQTADALKLYQADESKVRTIVPFAFNANRLQTAMQNSGLLTVYPAWPCEATVPVVKSMMNVLSIADRVLIPVDTMYTARMTHPPQCEKSHLLLKPLQQNELRIILPSQIKQMDLVPQHESLCRQVGPYGVCSVNIDAILPSQ